MPRYIDADALIECIGEDVITNSRASIECKHMIIRLLSMERYSPTADVAPRAELAREIFEEIDKLHIHVSSAYDANRYAELKKKYTEEKK